MEQTVKKTFKFKLYINICSYLYAFSVALTEGALQSWSRQRDGTLMIHEFLHDGCKTAGSIF